jgi:hypothetical protein
MRVSSEMTINTILAAGRRLVMTATWHLTEAQFNEQLVAHKMTAAEFENKMQSFTRNMVCAQKAAAAFIALGGQTQYIYVTLDGIRVASPVIEKCGE